MCHSFQRSQCGDTRGTVPMELPIVGVVLGSRCRDLKYRRELMAGSEGDGNLWKRGQHGHQRKWEVRESQESQRKCTRTGQGKHVQNGTQIRVPKQETKVPTQSGN